MNKMNTPTHIQGVPITIGMAVYIGNNKLTILRVQQELVEIGFHNSSGEPFGINVRFDSPIFKSIRLNPYIIPPDPEPCLYDMVNVGDTVWHGILGNVSITAKINNVIRYWNGKQILYVDREGYHNHATDNGVEREPHPTIFLSREAYNQYWDKELHIPIDDDLEI